MPIHIIDQQRRLREAGRIRIGQQVPTRNGKTRPERLDRFRFTSSDEQAIKTVAHLYGGDPHPWDGAPVGEQWEVVSDAKAIPVLVPPTDFAFSQWMELWTGGGCVRRCDGERDYISDGPCVCDPENRECKPHTRLSVILTDLEGIGTWRLDSSGFYAAIELNGAIEIVRMAAAAGRMLPARLLLEQRETKKPGEPTKQFAVPVLDLTISVAQLAADTSAVAAVPAVTPIPHAEPPALAEQMAAVGAAEPRAPRSNAQAALPPTGMRPRPAAEVSDAPPAEPSPFVARARALPDDLQSRLKADLFEKGISLTRPKAGQEADAEYLISEAEFEAHERQEQTT